MSAIPELLLHSICKNGYKTLLGIFLVGFTFTNLSAQCPNEDIELMTQEDIDNFSIAYPNCSALNGDLIIGTHLFQDSLTEINNLGGLINITSIGGNLIIESNFELVSLDGIDNITSVEGDLELKFNGSLLNVDALNNISSVGGGINFWHCSKLNSLDGLSSVSSFDGYLIIAYNDSIPNLDGLSNITSIGGELSILNSYALTNLDGLSNITSIGGELTIVNSRALTNLDGLSNVSSIGGEFSFRNNNLVTDFDWLHNVSSIGGDILIDLNDALVSLEGLINVTSVNGNISLQANNSMLSLNGLNNITSIDGNVVIFLFAITSLDGLDNLSSVAGDITVRSCPNLNNIDALSNLTSVSGDLEFFWNDVLTNLNGLNGVTSFSGENLVVHGNPFLTFCANSFFCNLSFEFLDTRIHDNGVGCNNETEIMESCDYVAKIYFPMFYDINENGLLDNDEPYLSFASVHIEPDNVNAYSNSINGGLKYIDALGDYTFSYNQAATPVWELTTAYDSYDITVNSTDQIDTVYFGLRPDGRISKIQSAINTYVPRCNEFVTFEVIVSNQGGTIADGVMWLNIDEKITSVEFIDTPDYIEPLRYGWDFENLLPGNVLKKQIQLLFPGPPEIEIGEWLSFFTQVIFNDANFQDREIQAPLRVQVECAFDPNDKLMQPSYPENYALIDETLIYTIRFQNTGNAAAFDVVIKDELDPNLDWNTFKTITSSHEEVLSTFLNDNELTFQFKDIFLPDSTTNFDASQGYVMYSIQPLADIEENTIIENTANIFFDFNPPIVTNTTQNNMVSTFDFDGDNVMFWEDCDDTNAAIYPNAIEIPYSNIDEDCNPLTLDDDLDQDGFDLSEDCDDTNAAINPDAIEFPENGIDENCDGLDGPVAISNLNSIIISVAPNPFINEIFISKTSDEFFDYQLFDFKGSVLSNGVLQQENSRIDLSSVAPGIFLLKIIDAKTNAYVVQKLVKI